jgi:hypothetical protein
VSGEINAEKVRELIQRALDKPANIGAVFPVLDCAVQLADEVELGNSAISKQIEVNSGLRAEIAKLREALGDLVEYVEGSDAYMTADEHPLDAARTALPKDEPTG